jgi:ATP-dependent HslUV protease, peptidase subunit HslV
MAFGNMLEGYTAHHMTTIVVVRKGPVAIIAADSLAKYGDAVEQAKYIADPEKLVAIGDAWLGPTGPASAQLILQSYFSDGEARRDFGSSLGIFETFTDLMGALKEDYHLIPKEDERDPYESLQMEVLIASPAGIFGVYPLRSVQEYSRFYAFGSGAEYALGAMFGIWDSENDPEVIARAGLVAAAEFDDSTDPPFTLHRVTLSGN